MSSTSRARSWRVSAVLPHEHGATVRVWRSPTLQRDWHTRPTEIVSTTAHRAAGSSEQHEHQPDDQDDDAECPQDRDVKQKAEEQKHDTDNNHGDLRSSR